MPKASTDEVKLFRVKDLAIIHKKFLGYVAPKQNLPKGCFHSKIVPSKINEDAICLLYAKLWNN